jgi:hypothetical protein
MNGMLCFGVIIISHIPKTHLILNKSCMLTTEIQDYSAVFEND